jgi:hypothetical protein
MADNGCSTCGEPCGNVNDCFDQEESQVKICITECGQEDPTRCFDECVAKYSVPSVSCQGGICTEGCESDADCQAALGPTGVCVNGKCSPMGPIDGSCAAYGEIYTLQGKVCKSKSCTVDSNCPAGYTCYGSSCVLEDSYDNLWWVLLIILLIVGIFIGAIAIIWGVGKISEKRSETAGSDSTEGDAVAE